MATKAVAKEVMTAAQISKPGGDFEIVEREIPDPGTRRSANQDTGLWCLSQ